MCVCACVHVCVCVPIHVRHAFCSACFRVYVLKVCVCVFSSFYSGPLLMCVPDVCVLYTQHYVVVGAGARVLS